MKAITIRDANGILVCFGPEGRGYDPGIPAGHVKAVEDDYNSVVAEYKTIQDSLPIEKTISERLVELDTRLKVVERK